MIVQMIVVTNNKILGKMLIINLLSILMMFFSGCKSNKAENETYILPNGYTGRIVIFYGQANGEAKKYADGARVLEIPSSGILKTQFEPNYGIIEDSKVNRKFLYKNTEGQIISIPNRHNTTVDSNQVQVFGISNGKKYPIVETKELVNGVERTVTKTTDYYIAYTEFIVDKYNERRKYDFKNSIEEQSYWEELKKKADVK
jgi:hypothetical protein